MAGADARGCIVTYLRIGHNSYSYYIRLVNRDNDVNV